MPNKKTENFNFEKSLDNLEKLIEKMEAGDLPLEKSLDCFEQGIKLTSECQKALQSAEQKVKMLSKQGAKHILTDFNTDEE